MEFFEVCILKLDRPSENDINTFYKVKDELNKKYSVTVCGETVQKFIVVPHSIHRIYYLMYRCNDLDEALGFRKEAQEMFKTMYDKG